MATALWLCVSLGCGKAPRAGSVGEHPIVRRVECRQARRDIDGERGAEEAAGDVSAGEVVSGPGRGAAGVSAGRASRSARSGRRRWRLNGRTELSLVAYQATVKCDGKELKARIDDPESNNVDGQMVVRPAPQEFKLADLAADRSAVRHHQQPVAPAADSAGAAVGIGRAGVGVWARTWPARRWKIGSMRGGRAFGLRCRRRAGRSSFGWIRRNFLLRRLDYPAAALVPDLANDPSVSELTLLADLREATIGEPVPAERFALDVPPAAKRMKTFVVPPRPLPSRLFGISRGEFHFTELIGRRLESKDLVGKIAVLVWYHDNPSCAATLSRWRWPGSG